MTKQEWKEVIQVRIEVVEENMTWNFPINCPRWLFKILCWLEK